MPEDPACHQRVVHDRDAPASAAAVGAAEDVLGEGQVVVAPFAILLTVTGIAQRLSGRVHPTAFRHPGLIGRAAVIVGLVLAGAWIWFVSAPAAAALLGPDGGWRSDVPWVITLGALASLGLHLIGGTRYSPMRLPLGSTSLFLLGFWVLTPTLCGPWWLLAPPMIPAFWAVQKVLALRWRTPVLVGVSAALVGVLLYDLMASRSLEELEGVLKIVVAPVAIVLLASAPVFTLELVKNGGLWRSLVAFGGGGSSRFASLPEFLRYDFTRGLKEPDRLEAPMFCGYATAEQDPQLGRRPLGLNSPYPKLTIAGIGGGKTLYAAGNVTPTWPGGMVVLDPKAQHAGMVGHLREKRTGRKSFYVDIDRDHQGLYGEDGPARWNPLAEIDIESPDAITKLRKIADCLFPEPRRASGSSEHFRQNGAVAFTGLAAHVLSTLEKKHHTMSAIAETLLMGHPDNGAADPKAFKALLDDMAVNEAVSRAPMRAAQLLTQGGKDEVGGFITTLSKALEWCLDEPFRASMACSDFQMRDVSEERVSVFLTPRFDRMQDDGMRRYMRLFFTFAVMGAATPRKHRHKPLILLDEFPQLGANFLPVKEGLVTLREAGVVTWIMIQNLSQLRERYENYYDFLSTSDLQVFAVNDIETASAVHQLLGEHQEYDPFSRRHDRQHMLRTPNEVMQDLGPGSKIALVKPVEGVPMRVRLSPFYRRHGRLGQ